MRGRAGLAIVGFGLIGRRHAAAIARSDGASVVGVAEPSDAGRGEAERLGLPAFASLVEMLDRTRPSAVILSSPTPLHVEQALQCIDRGLPVLVEKPLATTTEDGARIVAASASSGVPVLVGHHRRHNPLIARAFDVIRDGTLGAVRAVNAQCWFYKPDHYFAEAPWRTRKGAGPISVNLVHDIDLLRHLCGEIVHVQAQRSPSARGFENEDVAGALLRFESGAIGTVTVSDAIVAPWSWEMTSAENPAYPPTHESCYTIGGSRASLSIPDLRIWSHGDTPDWWTPISATTLTREASDPLVRQIEHFTAVAHGEVEPLVSADEGFRTLRVIEAIEAAALSGTAIELG